MAPTEPATAPSRPLVRVLDDERVRLRIDRPRR